MTKVRGSYDDYYNNPYYRKSLSNLIKYEREQKRKEKKEAEEKANYNHKIEIFRANEILPLTKIIANYPDINLYLQDINFNGKKYDIYKDSSKKIIINSLDDGREIGVYFKEKYEEIPDFNNYLYPNCPSLGSYLAGYIITIRYTSANNDAIQFTGKYSIKLEDFDDSFTTKKLLDHLEHKDIKYIIRDNVEAEETLNWNLEASSTIILPDGNIKCGSYVISSDFNKIISLCGEQLNYDSRENLDIEENRLRVLKFLEETTLKVEIAQAIQKALEDITKRYTMLQANKKEYDLVLLLAKKLVYAQKNAKNIVESFSREELQFITNLLQTRLLDNEEDAKGSIVKVKKIVNYFNF